MKIVLFANTDWYLYNFRQSLARTLRDGGHEVLLLSPPGPYASRFAGMGLRWEAAPMERRSLNPLKEIALILWLHRLLRAEKADLVHAFTIKCAVYGSLAARMAGVQARVSAVTGLGYVFTADDSHRRLLRPLVMGMIRLALSGKGSRLILQNPDDVAVFCEARLVKPASIRLIRGSGVDCTRFMPRSTPVETKGAFRVVLPARLLWDKGIAEYVEAGRILRAQGRPVELLLAGNPDPGNPGEVPESTVRAWVAEGLVRWLGHVDDVSALYQTVDAVVLPSYREGLPRGLIEAGAAGLPLVTTDAPGCREVVSDGVDGLLVPAGDSERLAGAIARLQDDKDLRKRLGEAARRKALTEFDEKIVIERTLHVYRELVQTV